MASWTSSLFKLSFTVFSFASLTHAYINYANDFINPNYVLSKNFDNTTIPSQQTILAWADQSADGGPWSVTTKPYLAPSGDIHDYMSWAPYAWPNCSNVDNTTELTSQEIWSECIYYTRDGLFNPDGRAVNNVGDFDSLANAVLFNSLAWALNGSDSYAQRVAQYINAWFIDNSTYMNPNLNYAQMQRGIYGQNGTHTGVLDLKCMAKIASGVLVLRQGKAQSWTSDIDTQFQSWLKEYITWMTTNTLALQEKAATNNHGSFYYNQLASLQVLVDDLTGANETLQEYFTGIYMGQINSTGDQPLESIRTRPYHYRAYNLAAMITNARLGDYVGHAFWNHTTNANVTIQAACDHAITQPAGNETASELYPDVAAVAAVYGDAAGTYAAWLKAAEGSAYVADASFFWDQPLADSGYAAQLVAAAAAASASASAPAPSGTGSTKVQQSGALSMSRTADATWARWILFYTVFALVVAGSLVESW